MVAHVMNESVKGALLGASFGGVIWLCTGMWQFFAVALVGVLCTWVFTSPPDRPQPRRRVREFVHVEIRDIERLAACYDYGGCQWRLPGRPVVLGPGEGCEHTRTQDLRVRPSDCTCDDVPCVCSPRDTRRGHLPWG